MPKSRPPDDKGRAPPSAQPIRHSGEASKYNADDSAVTLTSAKRHIFIRHAGDKFRVVVRPEMPSHPLDRLHDTHRDAYGYAVGLRMTLGLGVVDQTKVSAT